MSGESSSANPGNVLNPFFLFQGWVPWARSFRELNRDSSSPVNEKEPDLSVRLFIY